MGRLTYGILFISSLLASSCRPFQYNPDNPSLPFTGDAGRHFNIEQRDGYKLLTIRNPWQGAAGVEHTWYLVKEYGKAPDNVDPLKIINVPVKRIIPMSTTYLPVISALGEENSVVGVSGAALIFDDEFRKRVRRGQVSEVGYEDNIDKELIVRLAPDLIMAYGVTGETSGYLGKLRELGIKVLFNADYLEKDPLAKAEWIKVFGALYCREEKAGEIFDAISAEYNRVSSIVKAGAINRPKVMLGLPWKDAWYVSPGNSFISKLISDAGGEYIWSNIRSESSMPYGVEHVWLRAQDADYWLNISTASTLDDILLADSRLGDLSVFRTGNLYNNNRRVAGEGGNDYWESGTVKPHIILKDIASILHPELFPGYQQYYYRKIVSAEPTSAND